MELQGGSSNTVKRIDTYSIQKRQKDAERQRLEREKRLEEKRLMEEKARQDLLDETRRRQLELQSWRRDEEKRLTELEQEQRRRVAFESQALSDPERLVGHRAHVNGCSGTIEAWYPAGMGMEGRWKILMDDGHEEELTKISADQVEDLSDVSISLEQSFGNSNSLIGRAVSAKSLAQSFSGSSSPSGSVVDTFTKGLIGVRIHVDVMGSGVVSEYLGECKRDKYFGRMCFVGNRRPTHKVLFDTGREEEVNLGPRGSNYVVLPDLEETAQERRCARDSNPAQLHHVMDALNASLKACRAWPSSEEVQKGKTRLESLVAGLEHAKDVLSQSPESLESARPCLQEMLGALQRITRSLENKERIGEKQAERKLAFDDLERARWDLVFQLNLEAATGKMNERKLTLEAAATRANLRKHEIHAKDIVFGRFLGEGGFAKVYRCEWQGAKAAAKCFDLRNLTARQHEHLVRSFNREAEVAFNLRSPRLLQIFGICTSVADRLYIIMELAVGGTVRVMLDAAKESLPPCILWGLARDTAFAMRYLHGQGIVHRDLKSQNVLLDADGGAKVADFGVARTAAKLQEMCTVRSNPKGLVGTVAWMAPEALHGEAGFASDVFSFGVFAWEVATRKMPWEGENIANIIYKVCFKNARLSLQERSIAGYDGLPTLLSNCWEERGDARPTFDYLEKFATARYSGASSEGDDLPAGPPPARKPKKELIEVNVEPLIAARRDGVSSNVAVVVAPSDKHLLATPKKLSERSALWQPDPYMHAAQDRSSAFPQNNKSHVSQAPPSRPVCPKASPQQTPLAKTIGYSSGQKMAEHTPMSKQRQADFEPSSSIKVGPRRHGLPQVPSMSTLVASRTQASHPRLVGSAIPRDVSGQIMLTNTTPKMIGVPLLAQTGPVA